MIDGELRTKILFWSKATDVDPDLIGERGWRYLLKVDEFANSNGVTYDTESTLQRFSWGLMQVMGSVAREYGMLGPLIKLTIPDVGLLYGCKHFKNFVKRYGNIPDAVSSYNQGSPIKSVKGYKNQEYVDKVMKAYQRKMITIGG